LSSDFTTPFSSLHLLAGSTITQAAADVVHAAGDVIERFVLQAGEVPLDQLRHLLKPLRQEFLLLHKLSQRGSRFVRLDQLLMSDHAVEQQRRGVGDVARRQPVELREHLVVQAVLGEPPGVIQA
jgi:hypothetical protein